MSRTREPRKDELIAVVWEDANQVAGWLTEEAASLFPLAEVKSVGFFLNKDKTAIRISGSLSEKERDVLVIPIKWVKRIKFLRMDK